MPPLVALRRSMHDLGIGQIRQVFPSHEDGGKQRVHILHLAIVVQDLMQSFQSAALDAQLLGMRQYRMFRCLPERKGKIVA